QIAVDRDRDVGKPLGRTSDDEHVGGDELQDLDLADDDGTTFDDQAALVAPAEPAGAAARENRRRRRVDWHVRDMMTDARIRRVLAASLHQAIGDVLPQRLDFYEVWLKSEGLRDGSIGLAPMTAV